MLRTLGLRGDHEPGRDVRDAHGGFHFVHVLAAFAAGAKGVHLKLRRAE